MKPRTAIALACLGVAWFADESLAMGLGCDPLALRAPDGLGPLFSATAPDSMPPWSPSSRTRSLVALGPNAWEPFTSFSIGFSNPTMILDHVRDRLMVFAGSGWHGPSDEVFVRPADGSGRWDPLAITGPRPSAFVGGGAFYDARRDRMVIFSGAASLGIWAVELAGDPRWARLDAGIPGPQNRIGASITYDPVGDRLLMFGGWENGYEQDVWAFAFGDASGWSPLATQGTPPSPRAWQTAVLDSRRHRMLVFGGEWTGEPAADLWALTLDENPSWERLDATGDVPPLVRQSAAAYDPVRDRFVVHGGWNPGGYDRDELWELPLDGALVWQKVELDPHPGLRAGAQMVHDAVRDRMILFGGAVPDLWTLELGSSQHWTSRDRGEPDPGFPRYAAAAAWDPVRRKALLFAGQQAMVVKGFRRYDIADLRQWHVDRYARWDAHVHADAPIRGSAALVVDPVGQRVLAFGGRRDDGLASTSLLSCALEDGAPWQELAVAGEVPGTRRNATMVLDPVRRRVILFGGRDATVLGDTWILSLDGSPAWQRVDPPMPSPEPRFGHVMAYDPIGDRMLLLGGQGASGALSDAWQLSLEPTLTWSPVPAARLPGPRGFPSLVTDTRRNRLVLFGGRDASGLAHADTWFLPLAPEAAWTPGVDEAGGPEPRWAAAAVYDPDRDRVDIVYGTKNPCGQWDEWQLLTGASLKSEDPPAPHVRFIGAHAVPGRISLEWQVEPAAVVRATLQRRGPGGWENRSTLISGANGWLRFEEADAPALSDAEYRVVVSDGRFAAASSPLAVHVPSAAFALRGVSPSSDGVAVALALPDAAEARLELVDVSGRRIRSRQVGGLGPGDHQVRLAAPGELPPGLYLVRLLRAGESKVTRIAVTH